MLVQELKACDAVDLLVNDGWSFDEAHEIVDFYIEEAIDNSEDFLFDVANIKYDWVSYENLEEAQIYYPMAIDLKQLGEFVRVIETKDTILVSAV
tara:strand:+ start:598 stop:882 length:285 start_codon:yes stop_codon:yes gene_type:complete